MNSTIPKSILKCPHCRGPYLRHHYRLHIRGVRIIDGKAICPAMKDHPNYHRRDVNLKLKGKAFWRLGAL